VEKYRDQAQRDRTIKFANPAKLDGEADFFVLLSTSQNDAAKVEGVTFISGDEKLKEATGALRTTRYTQRFPDETPAKILRRGKLSCRNLDCTFLLMLPDDVRSVD
jgi:hypothetical protein